MQRNTYAVLIQKLIISKLVFANAASDPRTSREFVQLKRRSICVLRFNKETSCLTLHPLFLKGDHINNLTFCIQDIKSHENITARTIDTFDFKYLNHTTPIKLR